jgi:hypothetical protein
MERERREKGKVKKKMERETGKRKEDEKED